MAKEVTLDSLRKNFNFWEDNPEKIYLDNIVFNGMFNGYLPIGSLIQIAAQSGVGKSTLALQLAENLLALGKRVLYIDAEGGLNIDSMTKIGVMKYLNTDSNPNGTFVVVRECDCGAVNTLIRQVSDEHLVDFIFVDSLGALDANLYAVDGVDANNPKVGSNAKSLKIVMNTMNRCKMENKTTFICINHLAQSIGTYIPTESPVGGRSVVYLSDIIIKLTKKSSDLEKTGLGQKVEFEATKSRFGFGKCKVPFYILFGKGISMVPTYKEAMINGAKDINGRPFLDMGGAGTGVLHLGDEEFKYRGEVQLMSLIGANLEKINKLMSPNTFVVQRPEVPDYYDLDGMKEEITNNYNTLPSEELKIPDFISKEKCIRTELNKVYLRDGIDSTGQIYQVYYDIASDTLISDCDGVKEETNSPNKVQLKEVLKI